jgi:hypothetical protein
MKTHAIATSVAVNDCEKNREACIKSCSKQRQDCDSKGNESSYCVKQDQQCTKGCNDAWRKCSEKSSISLFDFDPTKGSASLIQ